MDHVENRASELEDRAENYITKTLGHHVKAETLDYGHRRRNVI